MQRRDRRHGHLRLVYRKVFCPVCQAVVVEDLELVDPWKRVTRRLVRPIR